MSQRGLKMHQTEVGLGLNWHTDQSLPLGGAVVLRTLFCCCHFGGYYWPKNIIIMLGCQRLWLIIATMLWADKANASC